MSVHSVLLNVLHTVFALWTWLQHVITTVAIGLFHSQLRVEKLLRDANNLKRLPMHVAVVIEEDPEFSYSHLASIVVWCSAMGISCISFYDHHGFMKTEQPKLSSSISVKYKQLMGTATIPTFKFKTNFGLANGFTNGVKGSICKINLLSHLDGMRNIVHLARDMSRSKCSPDLPVQDVTLQKLDDKLRGDLGSWPDLLLCCGNSVTTIGFLPWHLHLTEIMYIRTHRHLTYNKFVEMLARFSKCEQRCGK